MTLRAHSGLCPIMCQGSVLSFRPSGDRLLWSSWPLSIYTHYVGINGLCLWPLSPWVAVAALSSRAETVQNLFSSSLFCFHLTSNFHRVRKKAASHGCATKEQIRWNQRGVQWLFYCVKVYYLSCSSQLPPSVYQSVSPHMVLFLAGKKCEVLYFYVLCWGGATVKSFREIQETVSGWCSWKYGKWWHSLFLRH